MHGSRVVQCCSSSTVLSLQLLLCDHSSHLAKRTEEDAPSFSCNSLSGRLLLCRRAQRLSFSDPYTLCRRLHHSLLTDAPNVRSLATGVVARTHALFPPSQETSSASGPSAPSRQPARASFPCPPTSAVGEDKHAEPPVDAQLLQEIKNIISLHPPMTWMPVSDLYADLSPRTRREHVRPHKSMLHVLQKVKAELNLSLNATGVFYAVGQMPAEAPKPKAQPKPQDHPPQKSTKKVHVAATAATTATTTPAASAPSVLEELRPVQLPPVDFYYDVGLTTFPPPPPDLLVNPSDLARRVTHSSADGAVIAVSDFIAYIPPFFAPVGEVLARMPGYTEEHLQRYFLDASMEVVAVSGQRFIRVHGGYEKLSLAGCEAAEEAFPQYRPDPSLAVHFEKAFEGVTEKWMPLPELLRRVDPAVVAQLPFQGPAAIIYFAQMQHKFAFAVRQLPPRDCGGGGEAAKPTTEAAVLLRRPDYGGLECETTPTPKSLSHIFTIVPKEGQMEIAAVEQQLTPAVRAEVTNFYGGLPQFFAKHAPLFYVPPETPTVVMRLRYRQRIHVATLPLEEQLAHALKNGKKSKIRIIRRRIAFRDNPSHPFLDPENLAKELSTYLPRRGFVSMKRFLKHSIPEELVMFLPPKIHNFFKAYPHYFTQFEYQTSSQWCLCRPDQPLPRGVIRQTFSEGDLVRMTAEFVQKRGPRQIGTVLLNLPRGAQELVKKRYGGMYHFVTQFPQYFNVVLGSDNDNALTSGVVHLIQVPGTELEDAALASSAAALNDPYAPTTQLTAEREDAGAAEADDDDDEHDGLD